jgi:hypothetical protein
LVSTAGATTMVRIENGSAAKVYSIIIFLLRARRSVNQDRQPERQENGELETYHPTMFGGYVAGTVQVLDIWHNFYRSGPCIGYRVPS